MGYLIPTWQMKEGAIPNYRNALLDAITHRAVSLGMAREHAELKIDDLTPADLGLKSWDIILPRDSRVWIDHKIEPNKLIGIYKVIQLGKWSKIDAMVVKRNGYPVSHYSLAHLYIYGQEGFFNEPHVIDPPGKIGIEIDGSNESGERLALGGFVVSKKPLLKE